jgi:hypothetical protein
MFFLTYAMIDSFDHFYANINRAYMARLVVAPMVIVMLVVMWSMYANTALNFALSGAFAIWVVIVVGLWRSHVPDGVVQVLRCISITRAHSR